MLTAQRRHQPPCKRPMWDKGYTKCTCPVMIRGTLNGKHLTLSTRKFLPPDKARDLEASRDLALLWEPGHNHGHVVRHGLPEENRRPRLLSDSAGRCEHAAEHPGEPEGEHERQVFLLDWPRHREDDHDELAAELCQAV